MINLWLVLRDDAKVLINTALSTPEENYSGPVNTKTRRIFERLVDLKSTQRLFKSPDIGGNVYHLYSLIFTSDLKKAKAAVDYLVTRYPNHIIIGGAWYWDGTQVPGYPPHAQLLKLMPDVYDSGTDSMVPATVVTDVNLLAGQSPRDFS